MKPLYLCSVLSYYLLFLAPKVFVFIHHLIELSFSLVDELLILHVYQVLLELMALLQHLSIQVKHLQQLPLPLLLYLGIEANLAS